MFKKLFIYFGILDAPVPNYSDKYKCLFVHIPKTGGTSIESVFGWYNGHRGEQDHRTILEYRKLLGINFDTYFSFSIVRNPWDRAVSSYLNVKRDVNHQKHMGIKNPDFSFSDFIYHYSDCFFLRPQMSWISDKNGHIIVNKICRFENLQEDFSEICQIIGAPIIKLPHLLKTKRYDYRDFYTSDLINKVNDLYKDEIEFFGYKFDA